MLKRYIIFSILFLGWIHSHAQQMSYWQQDLKYQIDVTLNDSLKHLDAELSLTYKNNAPDTLKSIWFHCWPNAYQNDRSPFSEQLLMMGRTDFYFSPEEKRGYLNGLTFNVNGIPAKFHKNPSKNEFHELLLEKPIYPGEEILIQTPFHVKLPYHFSRSGYVGNSFQITQWYPKPAVYDQKGWHIMPYLDQGEFYGEFGSYEVSISVPEAYEVEATGKMTDKVKKGEKTTWIFKQEQVHDFAWFANKNWVTESDTLQLNGKTIEITGRHYNRQLYKKYPMVPFIKEAIRSKSEAIGSYPYSVVKVVESPLANGGGMEYPTITLIDQPSSGKELEELIVHEVGHNWFYGILGSNEREHPWLDEGINSYYDKRYFDQRKRNKSVDSLGNKKRFASKLFSTSFEELQLLHLYRNKTDLPISSHSESFNPTGYNLILYKKAAKWMDLIEKKIGVNAFDSMMQSYYQKWSFKHPYPEDFKTIATPFIGPESDSIFRLLDATGSLEKNKSRKKFSFFNLAETNIKTPLFAIPLLGYNTADGFMAGGVIHNYAVPSSKFQFLALPLFSPRSGKINGLYRIEYDFINGKSGSLLKGSLAHSKFSNAIFKSPAQKSYFTTFQKTSIGLKYQFPKSSPLSTTYRFLEWKHFQIRESNFRFETDTNGAVTNIRNLYENRYLNTLTYHYENHRKLYPHSIKVEAEHSNLFARLQVTAKYHFNYADGGGLDVRSFAGKFFYLKNKTNSTHFETERFHFNMTGPNGYEDYAYQDYFVGRNNFDDFYSRQIMERDGYFKVRTDLLSSKVGRDDNWLFAVNLSTTIPDKINVLKLLPVKIPLRLFADLGTNGLLVKNKLKSEQFLYNAGLELRLLNETLVFYFPLLYSKPFKEYIQSTIPENKFWKTMSFSIQIRQYNWDKIISKWL